MFSADMLYYTTPAANILQPGDRVYITHAEHSARVESLRGTLVDLKPEAARYTVNSYGLPWLVTADGYHVQGHVVNQPIPRYRDVIAPVMDSPGVFMVGTVRENIPQGATSARLYNIQRSDRAGINGEAIPYDTANLWLPAAPWARMLLPQHTDSDDLAVLRRDAAKARWELNHAIVAVFQQGLMRDWAGDLAELREQMSWLPDMLHGVYFSGHAWVVNEYGYTVVDQDELSAAAGRLLDGTGHRGHPAIRVRASFPAPLDILKAADIADRSIDRRLVNAASRHFGAQVAELTPLGTRLVPVVTGLFGSEAA